MCVYRTIQPFESLILITHSSPCNSHRYRVCIGSALKLLAVPSTSTVSQPNSSQAPPQHDFAMNPTYGPL
jgi:hypothetical protein